MIDQTALRIDRCRLDDPVARVLVEEVQAEYVLRYGGPDEAPMDVHEFDLPAGAFFVGFVRGEPAASGAWRMHHGVAALGRSRAAEIKRMYVRAAFRRAGLARAMLAHLETTAKAAGADLIVLETGLKQPEALELYRSSGYLPIPRFGFYKDYPNARHLGKPL